MSLLHQAPLLRQDGKPDGRVLRTERTRQRILAACRGYFEEGNYRPRGDQIARRARVSTRSVFNTFADLNALRVEALSDEQVITICAKLAMLEPRERVAAFLDGKLEA